MGLFSTKDRHEFKPLLVELEDSPTSPLARWLFWTLVIFMILIVLWLYLGKIDVVVSGQGRVMPSGEIKIVQPVETGVIKKILIKEGEFVREGQALMEIDPSVTETNLGSKESNSRLLTMEIDRLNALINDENLTFTSFDTLDTLSLDMQKKLFRMIQKSHEKEIELIQEQIIQVKEQKNTYTTDLSRMNKLCCRVIKREKELKKVLDLISTKDYEVVKNQIIEYQEQKKMKMYDMSGLDSKLLELHKRILLKEREYKSKLLEELTQKRKELTLLKAEIKSIRFQNTKQIIKSPVDGYIGKLLIHSEGGVVSPAEKLMTIIPKNAPLVFKATVLNQDIGFIKEEMNVSIKINTFNFQKYGLIKGKVTHISDDAIEDEQLGSIYEVLITPQKYYLEFAGDKFYIQSGMSITAEMKVGKRRVINFFIYPLIRYLDEGMSVR